MAVDVGLVSVVMSFYNSEDTLDVVIRSVFAQSYRNIELIAVDNCSRDSSREIVEGLKKEFHNIVVLRTEENTGGPSAPRNLGVNASNGEYIAFIDSDDVWYEDKIERQVSLIGDYDFICSNACVYDVETGLRTGSNCEDLIVKYNDLLLRNSIIHSSVLVKKNLFEQIMFDEDRFLIGFEDYSAYLRYIYLYGSGIRLGEMLVEYRKTDSSLGEAIRDDERFVKSLYCLLKTSLSLNAFSGVLYPIISRFLGYSKKKFFRVIIG